MSGEFNDESFNQEFCDYLERYINSVFEKNDDKRISALSCDGILPPFIDKQLTKKSVNDTKRMCGVTVFFLGGDAHSNNTAYDLTIKFGKYSLRRYARGSSMVDCIPGVDSKKSIIIDTDNRKLEIRLK